MNLAPARRSRTSLNWTRSRCCFRRIRFSAPRNSGGIVESDELHSVLRACFERWDKRPSISERFRDYLTGRWRLWIYPVRRELKAVAKVALIDDGLPNIGQLDVARTSRVLVFRTKSL
jgi:hypothetical protein